ncbi:MAG TPA: type IV toxin-antitoxin system AbiEi family antitoxin [Arachidicoccus sp.]|nr:type IV toxin-antitoxin system AbiEi family antitoxin [Arachidicoccus sp.]
MSPLKLNKINRLVNEFPPGIVLLSSWLVKNGYSYDLQKSYRNGNWLMSIGTGAMIRPNEKASFEGAVYALQNQTGTYIHPGGRTALSLLNKAHYLELNPKKITLLGDGEDRLPAWFRNYDWGVAIDYHRTSMLPPEVGLIEIDQKQFKIKISDAIRAIMECLYLADDEATLTECYELMEGLNNLIPAKVQSLLEQCNSIKVKRLFLYFAEKARHQWFYYLDIQKVFLGKGKRSIIKNGTFIPKYQITVPQRLA